MFKASQLNSNRVTLEQGLLIPVFLFLITLPFSGYGSHRRVPGLSNPGTLPSRTSPVGQAVLGFSGSDGWPFLPSSAKCLPAPIDPLPVKDHLGSSVAPWSLMAMGGEPMGSLGLGPGPDLPWTMGTCLSIWACWSISPKRAVWG